MFLKIFKLLAVTMSFGKLFQTVLIRLNKKYLYAFLFVLFFVRLRELVFLVTKLLSLSK